MAEANPGLVARLVSVAALAPVAGACFGDPSAATSKAPPLFIGDAAVTRAIRFDHPLADPAFGTAAKAAFQGDMSDTAFEAVVNLLTPDAPAAVFGADAGVIAARWGSLPRTWIHRLDEQATPIAAQDRFIAEGDALRPATPVSCGRCG